MYAILLALLGCPSPKDDTGTPTDSTPTDSTPTDDTAEPTCEDVDGDAAGPADAPGCAAAGGVCVGAGSCGGTVDTAHSAECIFDDGDGECCLAPEPAASGDTCADLGGVCAPVGGCYQVDGWFGADDGGCTEDLGPVGVCCLPNDTCEGWGTFLCCQGDPPTTAYVASCARGEVSCPIDGTELVCEADCQP